jgi:hypothetical protein
MESARVLDHALTQRSHRSSRTKGVSAIHQTRRLEWPTVGNAHDLCPRARSVVGIHLAMLMQRSVEIRPVITKLTAFSRTLISVSHLKMDADPGALRRVDFAQPSRIKATLVWGLRTTAPGTKRQGARYWHGERMSLWQSALEGPAGSDRRAWSWRAHGAGVSEQ